MKRYHKSSSKTPYAILAVVVLVGGLLWQNHWVVPEFKVDLNQPGCPNGFLYSAIPDPVRGVCIPVPVASGSGGGGGGGGDTTEPSIAITSPSNNQELSSGTKSTTITGTASDNVGLRYVEVAVNTGQFVVATGTTSWQATVQNLADGNTYTITVRATDTSGNTKSASILFKVKNKIIDPGTDLSNYRGVNYISPVLRGNAGEVSSISDIRARMELMASDGLNYIRVPFYWDHYLANPNQFKTEITNIVNEAGKVGIKVQLDFHHFHTGSLLGGNGFPSKYFSQYPPDPVTDLKPDGTECLGSNGKPNGDKWDTVLKICLKTSDRAWKFWQAYAYRDIPNLWEDQWAFMDIVFSAAQTGNSAGNWVAVEYINEPQIGPPKTGDTVDDVYRQLGLMNQFFADNFKSASYNHGQYVVVCEANGIGLQSSKIGSQQLAFPKGVPVVYAFHRYNSPLDDEFGPVSDGVVLRGTFAGATMKGKMLQEWSLDGSGFGTSEADMTTWMSKEKQYHLGWTYWAAFGGNDVRNIYIKDGSGNYIPNTQVFRTVGPDGKLNTADDVIKYAAGTYFFKVKDCVYNNIC